MKSRLKAYQQFSGKQGAANRCQNKALQTLEIRFTLKKSKHANVKKCKVKIA